MARPREHGDETREALLRRAGEVLREDGAAALSVRALADDLGVSTRAIYSLFGSKEGLVRAMFRAGFEGLAAELDAVVPGDDPIEDLRRLADAYRASAHARPHLYDVMFACPVPEFVPGPQEAEVATATLERLRAGVSRAIEAGAMAGEPWEVTICLWGLTHGLVSLELTGGPDFLDHDRIYRNSVAAMLRGLAPA